MQRKLKLLTNIEYSARMLLGALHRQIEVNPFDYIFKALNVKMELLEHQKDIPEKDLIE